ncbi:hypothetical protein Hdeb2414_s0006g00188031 [Helianthus debilis subsp. tardiflorus]
MNSMTMKWMIQYFILVLQIVCRLRAQKNYGMRWKKVHGSLLLLWTADGVVFPGRTGGRKRCFSFRQEAEKVAGKMRVGMIYSKHMIAACS